MLLEFSCTNHRSIKEKIIFSMLATKDNSHEDKLKVFDGYRVIRDAAIYGANGSGKSSFIGAVQYMKTFVSNSFLFQPGDKIQVFPHKLSEKNIPSSYDIQFITDHIRYAYGFSVSEGEIVEEYLYYVPNGKQAKIFDRKKESVSIGEKFKKDLESSKSILKSNKLFLSCAANFSNVKEIENVFLFFKEQIIIYQSDTPNNWLNYSVKALQDKPEINKIFLKFMKAIQPELNSVKVKYDKKKIDVNQLPKNMPEELKNIITLGEADVIDVKLNYEKFILDLKEESSGIKKLFEILCPIIDIILNGKILFWDEIETSLHPSIILEILKLFKESKQKKFAQLIFSTHNTSLLDLNLFRRDQIWFAELKNEFRSTDLYSLAELKNVRKDENICKGYISGKYGAIPMLNAKIADVLNEELLDDK